MTPQEAFAQAISVDQLRADNLNVAVAVSGGSDSMGLLVLAADTLKRSGIKLKAVTVNHGLRPEAAAEAEVVASFCAGLNISHSVLVWTGWNGQGNVQAAARHARYALLTDWAENEDIDLILLGHTKDDQAETVLMALARGSGVDGLTGMSVMKDGLFLRPLLQVQRQELRDLLVERKVPWVDDPSNVDNRYDRVKARQMMDHLSQLGLTTDRLVRTAAHMARAKDSLNAQAKSYAKTHVRQVGPDLILPVSAFDLDRSDTEPRVLTAAIQWISGTPYRPRFQALMQVCKGVRAGQIHTLNGVQFIPKEAVVRMIREHAACQDGCVSTGCETGLIWDSRWILEPDEKDTRWRPNLTVRAVGNAVSDVKNWRDAQLSHASAMATPGVFEHGTLISAPAIGFNAGFTARFVADFHTSPVFH